MDYKIGPKNDSLKSRKDRFFNKIFWFIGTSRNAILIVGSGILAAYCGQNGQHYFKLIGEIPAGLPKFNVPPFSILEQRNATTGQIIQMGETFNEMVSRMGSALIVIPLILLLENIAVCKAFGKISSEGCYSSHIFYLVFIILQQTVKQWMQNRN